MATETSHPLCGGPSLSWKFGDEFHCFYFETCVCYRVCALSRVRLSAAPWAAPRQAPLSLGFSSQNTGVGCRFLLQGILPAHRPSWRPCLSCPGRQVLHHQRHLGIHTCMLLGWPRSSFWFPACYGKTPMNFLTNTILTDHQQTTQHTSGDSELSQC